MRISAWLFIAAVVSSIPSAQAYVRSENKFSHACLFWPKREIPWALNEAGLANTPMSELEGALNRSFNAWEDVACSDIAFRSEGRTARRDVGFDETSDDNVNLLVFRETSCGDRSVVPAGDPCWGAGDCADVYGCWNHSSGIIALTFATYAKKLGVVVDADIEFNATRNRFTTTEATGPTCASDSETDCVATDVQNTATHEIGHLLGIDHSRNFNSVMYPTAAIGETKKRHLYQDDLDALCDIYPKNERVLLCTPSGTITAVPEPSSCGSAFGGTVLLSLFWARRRRRSSRTPDVSVSR